MPCIDAETSERMSVIETEDSLDKTKLLLYDSQNKIDKLTKIICKISKLPPETKVSELNGKVSYYDDFIKDHRKQDENRWFNKYKNIYPQFTKEEIIKMVNANILEG